MFHQLISAIRRIDGFSGTFHRPFVPYATAWDRLAQALLVSNEMMFID